MKKGFTLAELMVVLLIIGVITAITIPVLLSKISNTDKVLFKAAYKIVEADVNDLISDISLYPAGEFDSTFCTKFASKVNVLGAVDCTTSSYTTNPPTPNFKTSNGMAWYGFDTASTTLNDTDPDTMANIMVDIDGVNKGDNTLNSDILTIQVYKTGKVSVLGNTELEYLQN